MRSRDIRASAPLILLFWLCFVYGTLLHILFAWCNREVRDTTLWLNESKLSYLSDNVFALGRDFVYRWANDPEAPNVPFLEDCYEKYNQIPIRNGQPPVISFAPINAISATANTWIWPKPSARESNFNGEINVQLDMGKIRFEQLVDKGDTYRAKIPICLKIEGNSTAQGTFKSRQYFAVQTLEFMHKPLISYQLFTEGDTSSYSVYPITLQGPVHVNGNLYLAANQNQIFQSPVTIAGHFTRLKGFTSDERRNRLFVNESTHKGDDGRDLLTYLYTSTALPHNFKTDGSVMLGGQSWHNGSIFLTSDGFNPLSGNASFEGNALNRWRGSFKTKQRWLHVAGLDPIQKRSDAFENAMGCYSTLATESTWTLVKNLTWPRKNQLKCLTSGGTTVDDFTEEQKGCKYDLSLSQKFLSFPGLRVKIKPQPYFDVKKHTLATPANDALKVYHEKCPYVRSNEDDLKGDTLSQTLKVMWGHLVRCNYLGEKVVVTDEAGKPVKGSDGKEIKIDANPVLGYEIIEISEKYGTAPDNLRGAGVIGGYQSLVKKSSNYYLQYSETKQATRSRSFMLLKRKQKLKYPYTDIDNNITVKEGEEKEIPSFIFDKNRRQWVQLIDIDMAKMADARVISFVGEEGNAPYFNQNLLRSGTSYTHIQEDYANNRSTDLNKNNLDYVNVAVGIRLINAKRVIQNNLTIVSQFPLYIWGDFNTDTTKSSVAIVADSITVLSNEWVDWASRFWSRHTLKPKPKTDVTINAHLITGQPYPFYMPKAALSTFPTPEIGFINCIKILEDWGTYKIRLGGALISFFRSKQQWEPWSLTNDGDLTRSTPNLVFDPMKYKVGGKPVAAEFFKNPLNPPGLPFVHPVYSGPTKFAQRETDYSKAFTSAWSAWY